MVSQLEIFPNEVLSNILCYLSWDECLISFWSLNTRFNSLIHSVFEMNKNGIIFNKPNLSYQTFSTILFPLILDFSSCPSSNIKSIHFDENYSIPVDFISQDLFSSNEQQKISFPNLKSLYITRCLLSQPLFQTLSSLIQYQLDQLTLSLDEDIYQEFHLRRRSASFCSDLVNARAMFHQLLRQIFSDQCQLTSLELDMRKSCYLSHQCLKTHSSLMSQRIPDEFRSCCINLRHLHIHLEYTCFLEQLIDHVPNLEQLSVDFPHLRRDDQLYGSHSQRPILSNGNWFNKVPKLKCFTLKSYIYNDQEFFYLKWLLNNLSHVTKLNIFLRSPELRGEDQITWKSPINANFIRQHCLPDQIIHLKYFHFYIVRQCQVSLDDIRNLINSFQTDPLFISHQWTNIQCFYDETMSYQHIYSSIHMKSKLFDGSFYQSCMFDWSNTRHIHFNFHPSLYFLLERFDKLCPTVTCITIRTVKYDRIKRNKVVSLEYHMHKSNVMVPMATPFKVGERNLSDIQLRNVTTLRFGSGYNPLINPVDKLTERDKERAKIFAHLISMPVQLKYLIVEKFEWFLYVIQYAADQLRKNALSTVQYAEFGISSCNLGANESVHIGKHLVPLLSTSMPYLHTLRLWRPDDFPWTSLRPNYTSRHKYGSFVRRWERSLGTRESIDEHVTSFEQDLCQLHNQLKQFVFLEIYGMISYKKVELYRLMAQARFPNSRIDVKISRFRIWM